MRLFGFGFSIFQTTSDESSSPKPELKQFLPNLYLYAHLIIITHLSDSISKLLYFAIREIKCNFNFNHIIRLAKNYRAKGQEIRIKLDLLSRQSSCRPHTHTHTRIHIISITMF